MGWFSNAKIKAENSRRKKQMMKGVTKIYLENLKRNDPVAYDQFQNMVKSRTAPFKVRILPGQQIQGKKGKIPTKTEGLTTTKYAGGKPRSLEVALAEEEIFGRSRDGRLYLKLPDGSLLTPQKTRQLLAQGKLPKAIPLVAHEFRHALDSAAGKKVVTQHDRVMSEIRADASAVITALQLGGNSEVIEEALRGRPTKRAVQQYVKYYLSMAPGLKKEISKRQMSSAVRAIQEKRAEQLIQKFGARFDKRRVDEMSFREKVTIGKQIARRELAKAKRAKAAAKARRIMNAKYKSRNKRKKADATFDVGNRG